MFLSALRLSSGAWPPLPHQHEDAEGEGSNGTEVQIMFPSYLYVAFSPMLRLEGTQGIFK